MLSGWVFAEVCSGGGGLPLVGVVPLSREVSSNGEVESVIVV